VGSPKLSADPLRASLERFVAAFRDREDDADLAGEMAEHRQYLAAVAAFEVAWESAPLRFAIDRTDAHR
jgi:hypothetical protein